jgi:hypothetical protein
MATGPNQRDLGGLPEPPVTWPGPDSGFEADPFSPAGTSERYGGFFAGLGRARFGRGYLWGTLAVFGIIAALVVLTLVIH